MHRPNFTSSPIALASSLACEGAEGLQPAAGKSTTLLLFCLFAETRSSRIPAVAGEASCMANMCGVRADAGVNATRAARRGERRGDDSGVKLMPRRAALKGRRMGEGRVYGEGRADLFPDLGVVPMDCAAVSTPSTLKWIGAGRCRVLLLIGSPTFPVGA